MAMLDGNNGILETFPFVLTCRTIRNAFLAELLLLRQCHTGNIIILDEKNIIMVAKPYYTGSNDNLVGMQYCQQCQIRNNAF